MPLVVAFTGKIGTGKTTITKSLAEALGWPRASFGDYVRKVVREQGLPETRYNLQRVGTKLLRSDARGFCNSVLSSCGWSPGQSLIIDGLRHAETIGIIRGIVEPASLKIVFVSVPDATRLKRLRERGEGNMGTVQDAERHSSEQQVNSVLRSSADLMIEGDKPVGTIIRQLAEWVNDQ
jgi:dephospho-CoA kinase